MWTPLPTCFCVLNRFFTVRFQLKENFIATEYNILDNMCSKFGERLFQYDNSPPCKNRSGVEKVDWPAQSPDFNPINTFRMNRHATVTPLLNLTNACVAKIRTARLHSLVESLPRGVAAV